MSVECENKIEKIKNEIKALNLEYRKIREVAKEERKAFGQRLNERRKALEARLRAAETEAEEAEVEEIDLSAPAGANQEIPKFKRGSKHPLMTELNLLLEIYSHMGFDIMEARQLDDEFHMFDSLNFAKEHPARDGYDTFRTAEGFIPPAHTSTMQYRALRKYRGNLEIEEGGASSAASGSKGFKGGASSSGSAKSLSGSLERSPGQIAVVIPGRVFRNEDVDATHEHTFYQCEGIYVSKTANFSQMLGVFKNLFEAYYGQDLHIKTQPGYFPFTEPSIELLIEKPKSLGGKGDGWLEVLGCGMIHPNVLKTAGIDPEKYKGFAWGGGIDRLVMLKYGLNDVRYFESGKLEFLEEF